MKDEIKEILKEIAPNAEINESTKLLDSGIITSLNIMKLIMKLNDKFDVNIGADKMIPDNFNSIISIAELIEDIEFD